MKKLIEWVRRDGLMHFALSFIIALVLSVIGKAWWIGVVFSAICGIVKEIAGIIISLVEHRRIDWKDILHDLTCDFVGIILGVCAYFVYFSIVF